ncbi:uncharacterized protein LOC126681259 [Mercurialis annua]|uniref:uncharacterized protein LOC126681259 n=1 Tax=Mercurialis annua TaxID=3986 RepID=UPI00215FCA33|nr:uncharacterized protein LOC126681259 [Mercurialis annua]
MEKISAACAMEWSIELDKALRSKRPGQAVKAIQQIGARIQQWSTEPKPTMAAYNIFGLVLGEDRLFANTILLRLADVFRLGDRDARRSIAMVFLSEFRQGKKGRPLYKGILSKDRVHNQVELLKRVKFVFDTGDVESRALAMVLFGCFADFAKDSAHIRYLILSSLVSSEESEVKSSLFAASCFCELAADFASVVLEMLLNIILLPEASLTIRLAGVKVFAKMGSSYSIANKAYKIGLKLVLDSSEEDFLVAMLVSLSKLAIKSTVLLSEQVDLLLSFLGSGRTLRLQAIALKCLNFIFGKGVRHLPASLHVMQALLRTIDEVELPSAMQCEALHLLQKTLVYRLHELLCDNMLEFTQLFNVIEKAANSPLMPTRLLAIRVLVDVSTKLRGKLQTIGSAEDHFLSLLKRIVPILMDQIILRVKPLLSTGQTNSEAMQEFQSLLNLLLCLVRERPDAGVLVLNKVRSFIENVMDKTDSLVATRQAGDEHVDFQGQNCNGIGLILACGVHKFSANCIEILNEVSTITTEILDEIQSLVECMQHCKLFDHNIHLMCPTLLHSHIIWSCVLNKNGESCSLARNSGKSLGNGLVGHEIFSLEHAEKMMQQTNNWPAYKAGMFASFQGAWITASFVFKQLIGKAQSDSCSGWLKGLSQFALSEVKVQLFLLPNLRSSLVDWLQMKELCTTSFGANLDEIAEGAAGNINETDYAKVLVKAYHGLCLSRDILKSIPVLSQSCCFQRWFLALRAKVLRTVIDTLEVLGTISHINGNISNNGQVEKGVTVKRVNSLRQITQISFQFNSLAQEYDLMALSFIGMDRRSSKMLTALALTCSLLAFSTGFALLVSNLPDNGILTCDLECSRNYLEGMLIQSLVERLWFIDQETCSQLFLLSKLRGQANDCFLHPRNPVLNSGGEKIDILNVCKYAVSGILDLQNETKGVPDEEILSHITQHGSELVLKTITKWMNVPFRIPKYFFKLRDCIGSELLAFSEDTKNTDKITLSRGSHLSLDLCLQLRNMPSHLTIRTTKLYCILCCSNASKFVEETRGEVQLNYENQEISGMIALNKKLFHYVTKRAEKTDNGKCSKDYDNDGGDRNVYGFVSFELNDRGQGFSNCLLDVSNFPVGCYRIKWHSCLIDNQGSYWSLLPLNAGPVFTVTEILS